MRDINFFSPYIVNRKKNKSIILISIAIIFFIAISVSSLMLFYNYKIKSLKHDIEENKRVLHSQENLEKLNEIEKYTKNIEIMTNYFQTASIIKEKIENINIINTEIFKTISDSLPKDVSLDDISILSSNIKFSGSCNSKISIAEFEHNLKMSGKFENVYITMIEKYEDYNYSFVGKCEIIGD